MIRYEEIHNAALECSRDTEICHQWSFIKGAEWSDEHPREGIWDREKVCKWLEENAEKYLFNHKEFNEPSIKEYEMIDDLSKAMEE